MKGTLNGVVIPISVSKRQLIIAPGDYGYSVYIVVKNIVNPNVE